MTWQYFVMKEETSKCEEERTDGRSEELCEVASQKIERQRERAEQKGEMRATTTHAQVPIGIWCQQQARRLRLQPGRGYVELPAAADAAAAAVAAALLACVSHPPPPHDDVHTRTINCALARTQQPLPTF
jgi:hypothetical protein